MATTHLRGTLWEVSILGYVENLEAVHRALLESGIDINVEEAALRGKESSVYVSPSDVGNAVRVLNALGYETDEDEETGKDV